MPIYKAPLADMRFVLHELYDSKTIAELPDSAEFTPELLDSVLEEGAKFCEEVLFPLNQSGDLEGCTYENGVVRTPAGFKEAYKAFCDGGWSAMASSPEFGGQGMPISASLFVEEMMCSANVAFGLYPGLTHGAYLALYHHGSEEQKNTYLPKLVSGALADVLTGGDCDLLDQVTESDVMDLERKAFMGLIKTKESQARIKSIIETGKPLRN